MKLSKALKESIQKQALGDLFDVRIAAARKELTADAHRHLLKNHPRVSDAPDRFIPFIRKSSSVSIYYDTCSSDTFALPAPLCGDLPTLGSYNAPWDTASARNLASLYEERSAMKEKIEAVLSTCNTDKQLEATVPELAKYLPEDTTHVCTALIPVDTIYDVRRALAGAE